MVKNGFTLVEVMVSVAILSIGLVVISQGLSFSLNGLRISEDNLMASLACENAMAQAQILAKGDWKKFSGGLNEELEIGNLAYQWTVELESMEWPPQEALNDYQDLYLVQGTLAWQEGKRSGKIPLVTLMHSRQIEQSQ